MAVRPGLDISSVVTRLFVVRPTTPIRSDDFSKGALDTSVWTYIDRQAKAAINPGMSWSQVTAAAGEPKWATSDLRNSGPTPETSDSRTASMRSSLKDVWPMQPSAVSARI